jgi:hypothetical protein
MAVRKHNPGEKKPKEIAFWEVDEDLKPYRRDKLLKSQAERQYTGIIKFLSDNGMFKRKRRAVDLHGKLLIRQVFASDLTDEGIEFVKIAHRPWFRSKAAGENPTNIKMLEKFLKTMRG